MRSPAFRLLRGAGVRYPAIPAPCAKKQELKRENDRDRAIAAAIAPPKAENDARYAQSQEQRRRERELRYAKRDAAMADAMDDQEAFEAAAVRVKRLEAEHDNFIAVSGRTKRSDRAQTRSYDKAVAGRTVAAAEKHYQEWSRSIGANEGVKTLAQYYEMKYNNPTEFGLLRGYVKAVEKGDISPLVGFDLYRTTAQAVTDELVGMAAKDGTVITGFKTHFIDRVIGQVSENHAGKRTGVSVDAVRDALLHGTWRDNTRVDGQTSRLFSSEKCGVTINPTTGTLIQTNP